MKTRAATERITWVVLLLAASACGKKGPRYGDKTYGQVPHVMDATVDTDEPIIDTDYGSIPPVVPTPVQPAPPPAPPPPDEPPRVEEEDPGDEDPTVAADTVILSARYRAQFDVDSAQGIRDGEGFRSLGLAGNKVRENLTTTPDDGMVVAQTFGDGESKSTGTQQVTSTAGDANRIEGTPTTSGAYTLDRVVTPECPNVLLCVERIRFVPVEGDGRTVCFYDPASGLQVPFPYGVLPNYKAQDFAPSFGEYGPYEVVAHAGTDVDCAAPPATPLYVESVMVKVQSVATDGIPFYLHTIDPIPAQHSVTLEMTRTADDMIAPYLDETVMLNLNGTFVMNEDEGEIVKIVVKTRQSVDLAAQAGGGLIGKFASLMINLDGVVADLHFEMCLNLLDPNATDHCEAAP